MEIRENYSLKYYNTFRLSVVARYFIEAKSLEDLQFALDFAKEKSLQLLFLGGGSNVLFLDNFDGLVIKLSLKGISIVKETEDIVWIKAMAGENWHQFVLSTLDKGFGGLENLSLIPGNVGTAPMQNIGAYGVEIKDTLIEVEALKILDNTIHIFSKEACRFGYRESIFKNEEKGNFVLVSATFELTKRSHQLKTSYGAIQQELTLEGISTPTIKDISSAVIKIRQSKLPDPDVIPNSGSFFKNPSVSVEKYRELQTSYPEIVAYPNADGSMKIAAGWLIENAGWKGKRFGDAGVHAKQALVLVNYGNATGEEIYKLSEKIVTDIYAKYGIYMEREVNVIGCDENAR
ncbi:MULTISPECIES: UDP-N-acetylmuramate dehydrogenase [Weeksella]|uniref:UDP-N-acetylenolpyruvoylglucosamine reductase n=1 Tax=Weeksella virosa (strain ATCC 43766 / DSM 16922 / JCM 21250 / CCUG 30538 / CDC 9751 / IAM 14551 / NBRC 16016 / NCTC 11634 / CL345/78) TaxID=865938 RepID=F0NZW2_WEEVC|nr:MULTISPECIES: UDP-N-acetylmuramate dehydrogenase [Weeksella]ADX68386.1 UDP-N-acetylenolpyruvoylglucosamine reductase [Weeksella virosa DSM 16922]MDK7375772.1 UDP-N-acetylmuramate dehydrogenase [Weeksella virosa]MDK7674652.1 UDP-N-acetylmuramate dehydrogenase [Weeksella virosa]OFM83171.1 UDP-N-acetylenolpyruvoylglucosamine reductase [Weeksella sp. HMSC059D05]SUP54714.1 UDP-N-acetylenolpyruvoylglucosamine reductase [Weeksella virosa]